jgi:hypothetical protein
MGKQRDETFGVIEGIRRAEARGQYTAVQSALFERHPARGYQIYDSEAGDCQMRRE